ncbi:MAG: hypothetical protein ACRDWA_14855 [Acidimicrobiia bacterium]
MEQSYEQEGTTVVAVIETTHKTMARNDDGPHLRDWRNVVAVVIPTLVLTAVAVWQSIRTELHDQIPWVGAGFGMFATVDGFDRAVFAGDPANGRLQPLPHEVVELAESVARAPRQSAVALLDGYLGPRYELVVFAPVFDGHSDRLSWRQVIIK